MDYYYKIVDESVLKQLKESKYYHPEITDVIHDFDTMSEIAVDSFLIVEKGYDTVWDSSMFNHAWLTFREGLQLLEKQMKEKGVVTRLIVEATKDNIDNLISLNGFVVRHLDDIKGNFGIFDNRAYMVYIFNKGSEVSYQTLWSNSKVLVDKQQELFNNLWEIATPLALRRKELQQEEKPHYQKILKDYKEILDEMDLIIKQCRKELLIFSSMITLHVILDGNNFLDNLISLLRRGVTIKILTDNVDEYLIKQVAKINNPSQTKSIQLGYASKLDDSNEMVIISDNKYLLDIRYDRDNKLVATFSNEEHKVLVQELMFEKQWNEIKSLKVVNNN